MPSLSLPSAFLVGLCVDNGRLLSDPEFCDIYDLPEKAFEQKVIKGVKPHNVQAFQSFIIAAQAKRDDDARTTFVSGSIKKKLSMDNNHNAGREAYISWFRSLKLSSKIHALMEAALVEIDAHPKQLLAEQPWIDTGDTSLPDSKCIYTTVEKPLAHAVFGRNAFTSVIVSPGMTSAISSLLHHAWERLRKQRKKAHLSKERLRDEVRTMAKKLENPSETFTAQEFKDWMKAVNSYELAVEWHPKDRDAEEGVVEWLEAVKTSVMSLRGISDVTSENNATSAKTRGRVRGKRLFNNLVASEEDIRRIWTMYIQYFNSSDDGIGRVDAEIYSETSDDSETNVAEIWLQTDDLGVTKWRGVNTERLDHLLGYEDGRPPLFSKYRSKSGRTAWDPEWRHCFEDVDLSRISDLSELRPMWHQKVGVAAMVETFWTETEQALTPGVLLADKVGLGKSLQIMMLIAMIIDVYMAEVLEQQGRPSRRPPILRNRNFFGGKGPVPNRPHLIVVPAVLIDQWCKEFQVFFCRHSVDVYRFPTQSKDFAAWFADGSEWSRSTQPFVKRIVIVAHSTVVTQSKKMMSTSAANNKHRALTDPRASTPYSHEHRAGCLWSEKSWASLFVDEAHFARSPTKLFHGLIALGNVSTIIALATATPLINDPKDTSNLGRLLRIPEFMGSKGDEFDQVHKKAVAAERWKVNPEAKVKARELTVKRMRGLDVSGSEDPWGAVKAALQTYMVEIQQRFEGSLIKRDEKSVRFDGKPLNEALLPLREVIATCRLSEEEMNILEEELVVIVNKSRGGRSMDMNSANFYIDYRTRVAYAFARSGDYKCFSNMGEWLGKQGTKLTLLVKLLQHHLSQDGQAPATFDDVGKATFPEKLSYHNGQSSLQETKILVFQEFPMMADMIISVLQLHDIACLALNGSMTAEERDDAIYKFKTDPSYRVLLSSMDMVWSKIALHQIYGRAHRFGQEKEVITYLMVALGTVDVLMVDHGFAKGSLLSTFLSPGHRAVKKVLTAGQPESDDSDNDTDLEREQNCGKSRRASKFTPNMGSRMRNGNSPAPQQGGGKSSDSGSCSDGKDANKAGFGDSEMSYSPLIPSDSAEIVVRERTPNPIPTSPSPQPAFPNADVEPCAPVTVRERTPNPIPTSPSPQPAFPNADVEPCTPVALRHHREGQFQTDGCFSGRGDAETTGVTNAETQPFGSSHVSPFQLCADPIANSANSPAAHPALPGSSTKPAPPIGHFDLGGVFEYTKENPKGKHGNTLTPFPSPQVGQKRPQDADLMEGLDTMDSLPNLSKKLRTALKRPSQMESPETSGSYIIAAEVQAVEDRDLLPKLRAPPKAKGRHAMASRR